jgi:hypothetical protein
MRYRSSNEWRALKRFLIVAAVAAPLWSQDRVASKALETGRSEQADKVEMSAEVTAVRSRERKAEVATPTKSDNTETKAEWDKPSPWRLNQIVAAERKARASRRPN